MLQQIFALQESFDCSFSKRTTVPHVHHYRDENISDMYSSNFSQIYDAPDEGWIKSYIARQLQDAKERGLGHLKATLHPSLPFSGELSCLLLIADRAQKETT
ncbi:MULTISPECIES: hypothetical protein [Brevibacillus]|jgi:hypothetical protein|uniref:hypothetical protein n=1 Tax=Brevibacillus TaxID=55080 RepID=UPI00156BDB2A|nr:MULTISPECIES: hypothetical protein [Brevibacillus]MDH6348167.1 hypothetical protein [Brevibacillus sp. 1238]MDR5000292.1 hypothetical protein [Brevibacillus parabrevis]UED70253.1 hypothetical protein HP435_06390 [Brevibacillus sp. HD3.3A]